MKYDSLEAVAFELRRTFSNAGITYKVIGEATSLSPRVISNMLQGKTEPRFETLRKIADAFEVELTVGIHFDNSTFWEDLNERTANREGE